MQRAVYRVTATMLQLCSTSRDKPYLVVVFVQTGDEKHHCERQQARSSDCLVDGWMQNRQGESGYPSNWDGGRMEAGRRQGGGRVEGSSFTQTKGIS